MRLASRTLLGGAVATCGLVGVTAASSADAVANFGTITITGAFDSHAQLARSAQCVIQGPPTATVLTGSVIANGISYRPSVIITRTTQGGAAHAIKLAGTRTFTVQVMTATGTWYAGWGSPGGVPPYRHLGSGVLSVSATGKTGTLTATAIRASGTPNGAIQVKASWHCP
jgi:hypothetical protein